MRWSALLLAGCYAPTTPAGVPCTPPGPCPGEQVCAPVPGGEFQCVGEAPPSDTADAPEPPDPDVDGDGIDNADDNCPGVANASQANDDGDGFGDACDPCPPLPDPDPAIDPDGDGVSGACDPQPGIPGDQLLRFESFTGPLAPDWTFDGDWTFANGAATFTVGSDARGSLVIPQPGTAALAVMTRVTILDLANDSNRTIGPIQMHQQQPERGIVCGLQRNGDGPKLVAFDTSGPVLDAVDSTFDEGLTVVLANQRAGSSYTCRDATLAVTGTSIHAPMAAQAGVQALRVTARFDWILFVGR